MRFRVDAVTVALGVVLVSLLGAAFAFGAVESWAEACLRLGALGGLTALLWSGSVSRIVPRPAAALVLPCLAAICWAGIQVIPLPTALIGLLSPKTAVLFEHTAPRSGGESLPGWLAARAEADGVRLELSTSSLPGFPDAGDRSVGRTLSVYPHATRASGMTGLTMLVFFLLGAALARDEEIRFKLLMGIGACIGLFSLACLVHRLSGDPRLLWIRDTPPNSTPLGPFVNPDHAAGYVMLGLLLVFGLVLARLSHASRRLDMPGIRLALLDRRHALPHLLVLGGIGAASVFVLVVARSRGAWIAFGLGLVFLVGSRWLHRRVLGGALVAVVVVGLVVGLTSWLFGAGRHLPAAPLTAIESDASAALRLDAWARTFEIFLDHPIAGTGLGTFRWVFGSYLRAGEWEVWSHAHNDFAQWLAETGLVGFGILVWALIVFLVRVVMPALDGRGEGPRWTTAAAASAVFAMAVHSTLDFNLHIPATAALFSALVGVLSAAAEDSEPRTAPVEST